MLVLSPKRITATLSAFALVLLLISVARNFHYQITGAELRVGTIFSFGDQVNVPTWYSSSLMLLCALLMLVIAWDSHDKGDRFARHWGFLSLLLIFLSANEVVLLHRRLFALFIYVLPLPGKHLIGFFLLTTFVVGLFLAYRKFLACLPRQILSSFVAVGTLYFAAALIDKLDKREYWRYMQTFGIERSPRLLTTVDEMLELISVIILIHAVLSYMSLHVKELRFFIKG